MGNDSKEAAAESVYATISDLASRFNVGIDAGELAELAVRRDFGDEELAAIRDLFAYLADRHHQATIEMLLRLGRLPRSQRGQGPGPQAVGVDDVDKGEHL